VTHTPRTEHGANRREGKTGWGRGKAHEMPLLVATPVAEWGRREGGIASKTPLPIPTSAPNRGEGKNRPARPRKGTPSGENRRINSKFPYPTEEKLGKYKEKKRKNKLSK